MYGTAARGGARTAAMSPRRETATSPAARRRVEPGEGAIAIVNANSSPRRRGAASRRRVGQPCGSNTSASAQHDDQQLHARGRRPRRTPSRSQRREPAPRMLTQRRSRSRRGQQQLGRARRELVPDARHVVRRRERRDRRSGSGSRAGSPSRPRSSRAREAVSRRTVTPPRSWCSDAPLDVESAPEHEEQLAAQHARSRKPCARGDLTRARSTATPTGSPGRSPNSGGSRCRADRLGRVEPRAAAGAVEPAHRRRSAHSAPRAGGRRTAAPNTMPTASGPPRGRQRTHDHGHAEQHHHPPRRSSAVIGLTRTFACSPRARADAVRGGRATR
jgi:hypothetical protein